MLLTVIFMIFTKCTVNTFSAILFQPDIEYSTHKNVVSAISKGIDHSCTTMSFYSLCIHIKAPWNRHCLSTCNKSLYALQSKNTKNLPHLYAYPRQ